MPRILVLIVVLVLALLGFAEAGREVTRLAGELFGNWKSPRPYERIANPYRDRTLSVNVFQLVKQFAVETKVVEIVDLSS